MIGILYNKLQEMKQPKPTINKNPYTRLRKWKLFRKKILKQNLTQERSDDNVYRVNHD